MMSGMINYVVKCIKDDGDMKICVGKQAFDYQPNQAEIKELMEKYPDSSFAVVITKNVQRAVGV